ncbi:hypothetical protein F5144DRAFT_623912 [Chaetomium tenue]|uniref:Uncharacterized protein n=1 Tax=Chaetomium tenue TaxID=1854479 RepID=A0ACB7NY48_9PEZI|nr:hypothetical protein F5144DRAFT_623912 [Chaetomium globosum]
MHQRAGVSLTGGAAEPSQPEGRDDSVQHGVRRTKSLLTAIPATAVTSVTKTRKCRRREDSGHQYHPRAGRLLAPQRDVADGDPHHDEGQDELRVCVPEPADLVRYPLVHDGRAPGALGRVGGLRGLGIRNAQMPRGEDPPSVVPRDGNLGVEEGLEVCRGWLSEVGALVCPSVVRAPEAWASALGVGVVVRIDLCGAVALHGHGGPGEFVCHAEVLEGACAWGRGDESMYHLRWVVNLPVRSSAANLPGSGSPPSTARSSQSGARRSSIHQEHTAGKCRWDDPESDSRPAATPDPRPRPAKLMGARIGANSIYGLV